MQRLPASRGLGFLLMVGLGCAQGEPPTHRGGVPANPPPIAVKDDGGDSDPAAAPERQRIVRMTLELRPNVPAEADERLMADVAAIAGVVDQRTWRTGTAEGAWKVQIPATRVEEFLDRIRAWSEIPLLNTTSEDVTQLLVDMAARLANKRLEEERLQRLLTEATRELDDVLTLERELSRVREQIDLIEVRQRTTQGAVAYTVIDIRVAATPTLALLPPPSFPERWRTAWTGSWGSLRSLIERGLLTLTVLLPWCLVFGPALWIGGWGFRRRAGYIRSRSPTARG